MAKPWESKHAVVSDIGKLCSVFNEPNNREMKMILLSEGRNPSPFTIDQVDNVMEIDDCSDTESVTQPNIEFIASMIRGDICPNYSNDYIEQAYGNRGCLIQNASREVSSETVNKSHINAGDSNMVSDLNPSIKEFIPWEEYIPNEVLGSGDFIPQSSKNAQKPSPKKCKLDPMTPEFNRSTNYTLNPNSPEFNCLPGYKLNPNIPEFNCSPSYKLNPNSPELNCSPNYKLNPNSSEFNYSANYKLNPNISEFDHSPKCSEVDHSPQHSLYRNNLKYNSLDSLSEDSESYDNVRTVFEEGIVIESVIENVPADHKENTLISHANSAPLKPSPLADGKLKRNCALQSMFDKYAKGETQFDNIEVNQEFFANLDVEKGPVVISKPSEAIDKVTETSEDSSQNSYNSYQSVDSEDSSIVPSEPLQDVAGCLNRSPNKITDTTLDPKSKVVTWLCTDRSQIFATQQLNIVPPPKPKPINLCDDAFAFKVKNTNVVKGKTSVECTKNIAVQTKTSVQRNLEEKDMDKLQPKGTMSVEVKEIYNKLLANQGKPKDAPSAPNTYENFLRVENAIQSSSNTLWDNIENAMHKKSWRKPKKWQRLI